VVWLDEVSAYLIVATRCLTYFPHEHRVTAGANLMGSDLYNNLIRYFITHLKELRDVRTLSHLSAVSL
jgi:hypothetical protein